MLETTYGKPIKEIIETQLSKYLLQDAAELLGVSRPTLYKWIKKFSVDTTDRKKKKLNQKQIDKIKAEYLKGKWPIRHIATMVECKAMSTVVKVLMKEGLSGLRRKNRVRRIR